jgi:hypothetical protein
MMSEPFLPRQPANTQIMAQCHCSVLGLSMMQGQKSLTLHQRSLLGDNSDDIATVFA